MSADKDIEQMHELLLEHLHDIINTAQSWFDSGVLTHRERERYAWFSYQLGMVAATARELVDMILESNTTNSNTEEGKPNGTDQD